MPMWSRPGDRPVRTVLPDEAERRTGLTDERDAARWVADQDRGWSDGDRLSFAVLEADDVGGCVLAGNVGLKNREETGRIGERETAEIGYWTALDRCVAGGADDVGSALPAASGRRTAITTSAPARARSRRRCRSRLQSQLLAFRTDRLRR
jgi:hypothetical protein